MILHPAIVALLLISGLVAGMIAYAAFFGVRILTHWNISSGSALQLALERSTYLVSTLVACALVLEIASLFLYIYTADSIHSRFVGAMCAAGAFNVNAYGYPALLLKIANCLLAGLWLIVNYADNKAYDYPLIRKKFILLLVIVPFVIAEAVLQAGYFLNMSPNIITSCCGSLFGTDQSSVSGDLAALPARAMMIAFFTTVGLTVVSAVRHRITGKGEIIFSILAVATFFVSVLSLLSFITLYFYELPTHHCPFCILQREYHYIGYLLYATLIGGVICGAGVGVLAPFKNIKSLSVVVPAVNGKLVLFSTACYLMFFGVSVWKIMTASLSLGM